MDNYTATELAYRNGYKNGYEQGKKDAVKHGRWVETKGKDTFRGYVTNYHCSQCGRYEEFKEHYCPNCGAKMDGGEAE